MADDSHISILMEVTFTPSMVLAYSGPALVGEMGAPRFVVTVNF
jgi:hypothetical protein